jgi:hypothetical protein
VRAAAAGCRRCCCSGKTAAALPSPALLPKLPKRRPDPIPASRPTERAPPEPLLSPPTRARRPSPDLGPAPRRQQGLQRSEEGRGRGKGSGASWLGRAVTQEQLAHGRREQSRPLEQFQPLDIDQHRHALAVLGHLEAHAEGCPS